MDRILITPRSLTASPPPALDRLSDAGYRLIKATPGQMPDEDDLIRLLPGCVGWLAGVEKVSARAIAAADRLRAISRNGVGLDNLPLEALAARGVRVTRAEGANAIGVAELTIGLMLAAAREIPSTDAGIKAAGWPRRLGREIHGATVGIVGCGTIGGTVARIAAALGASILAYDPTRPDPGLPAGRFRWAGKDELLGLADFVTLHCPPLADRALIDARALSAMRPGAILVNTARAALVDEAAVIEALDRQVLAGYATDVLREEPPETLALAGHPKVIATSHIGGYTVQSVERATEIAVTNLLDALGAA